MVVGFIKKYMARQDIGIDTEYGELETTDNIVGKEVFQFTALNTDDNFCYGEFTVQSDSRLRIKSGFEIHSLIPYKPIAKPLRVRFCVDSDLQEYILNPTNNSQWYDVALHNGSSVNLSEFRTVNEDNYFNLLLLSDKVFLYSGKESDLMITPSLSQNQSCLLKTSTGGSYQYPLTGVGLIDYLHGNFENAGLAQKLQKEFDADNMIVVNAYMDSESGELLLEVKEKGE